MDPQTITAIQQIAEECIQKLGFSPEVVVEVDESAVIQIRLVFNSQEEGQPDKGILIGYHGETLRSLQLILGMIINRDRDEWLPIMVDIDGYRQRREEQLMSLAQRVAEKVLYLKEPIALSPMSASDRRIVHMAVAEMDGVESESSGTGYQRKVVVKLA